MNTPMRNQGTTRTSGPAATCSASDMVDAIVGVLSRPGALSGPDVAGCVDAYLSEAGELTRSPWSPTAAAVAVAVMRQRGPRGRGRSDQGPSDVILKVIQHVHVLASGHDGCVPRHEAEAVREALGLRQPITLTYDGDLKGDNVTYAFDYATPIGVHLGHATAKMTRLDPADAPVVAVLEPEDGGGVRLRRMRDGRLLRPIMRPGGWEACDVAEFRSACEGAVAWGDNPFLRRVESADNLVGLSTCALPASGDAEDATFARSNMAEQRAGDLFVIDDAVHVLTNPPVLQLRNRVVKERGKRNVTEVFVGWSMRSRLTDAYPIVLHSSDDMRTASREPRHARDRTLGQQAVRQHMRLGDGDHLVRMTREWLDGQPERVRKSVRLDAKLPFVILDAHAFPSDDDLPFRAVLDWEFMHDHTDGARREPFASAKAVVEGTAEVSSLPSPAPRPAWWKPESGLDPLPLLEALVVMANEELARRAERRQTMIPQ